MSDLKQSRVAWRQARGTQGGLAAQGVTRLLDRLSADSTSLSRLPTQCPELRAQQQIEGCDVRDHQQRHIDDRDRVSRAQLSRHRGKVDLGGVVIVDNEVDKAHDIEANDEQPKQRTYPDREKCQHGEQPGGEVPIGGESREGGRQMRADHTWKDEDEPEKAEAV